MKKMKLMAVLLGMFLAFGGVFGVSAKVEKLDSKGVKDLKILNKLKQSDLKEIKSKRKNNNKNKKYKILGNSKELNTADGEIVKNNKKPQGIVREVCGQFDYFFNDGSMNKKYYGKQQNESKEIQPGNEGQFDNKTNTNHVLAFCVIFREGLRQALIDLLNEKGVKSPENCKFEDLTKKLSTKAGVNITKKDIEEILLYFSMCCREPNKNDDGEFFVLGTQFFDVRKEAYDFLKRVFKKIKNIKLTNKMVKDGRQYAIKVVNSKLKERNEKKKEILEYEDKEYFKSRNDMLMDIVRKFQRANLKRVKDVCDVFECKEKLREERIFNSDESKG